MLALMAGLHAIAQGSGEGIVLLHAFPLDGRMWEPQRDGLARTHRVIVPDLRGFGRSAGLPPARSVDEHADDVATLLDRLGVEAATVVGLSMGGYVALAMIRRHRSRVRALVLADTRATADAPRARAKRDENVELVGSKGVGALVETLVPTLLGPHPGPEIVSRVRAIASSQAAGGVIDGLYALRDRPDASPLLASIAVPTTVIVGAEDALSPPSEVKGLADAIAGARFVVLEGAGHLSNLERPEAFEDAVRAAAT